MSDDELIDGTYKLVMCIATGGSSQVWECVEQATGRHLAMKLLKQDSDDFKENKAGLKHEADVLKTLDHPLIIKFDRYSSSRDNTYMTMEHFRAANVKLQLKADIHSVHVRARTLFESVCQALSHVHARGWVHRDVKPDNVLMNKVGEIRLVDYSLSSKEVKGFSKMIGGGKIKTIQGTRTYIAPETIRKQTPTFQTDLYSLGIMFFEVLTGRTPFQAPTPEELLNRHLRDEPANASEFNKNVTPEMDRIIFRLLKKKPTDRPASVDEVLSEIKRIRIFKEDVAEISQADIDAENQTMDKLTELRLDSRADAKLSQMLQTNPELAKQFAEQKSVKSTAKKAAAAKVAERGKAFKDSAKPGKGAAAAPPAPPQAMMPVMMPQMMPPQMMPMPMMPGGYPPQQGYPQYPPQQQFAMPPGAVPPGSMPLGMPNYPMPGYPPPGFNPASIPQQGTPPGYPQQAPAPVPAAPLGQPVAAAQPVPPAAARQPAPPARPAAPAPAQVPAKASGAPAKPTPASPARPAAPAKPAPPAAPPSNPEELEYMTELPDVL